jgi:Domain of unknown function (DUF6431)
MAFEGTYRRRVREAGVELTVFIRRVHCSRCGTDDALLPDFVLRRRRDSASAIGAGVLSPSVDLCAGASDLYAGVPERTVRSWRQRFAERAEELSARFVALTASWGTVQHRTMRGSVSSRATAAIAQMWSQACRRLGRDAIPPAWPLANLIVGGQLLATRVDLPWPIHPSAIGHSRGP